MSSSGPRVRQGAGGAHALVGSRGRCPGPVDLARTRLSTEAYNAVERMAPAWSRANRRERFAETGLKAFESMVPIRGAASAS